MALQALLARLAESRRDHDERLHALCGARARRIDHGGRGDRDHRKLDLARHLPDRFEGRYRLDDVGLRVDRVDGAVEGGREQVVENFAADRAPLSRGADHGNRPRLEEVADRRHRRRALALVEALASLGGDRCRALRTSMRSGFERICGLNPLSRKTLGHPVVVGQHRGLEKRDAVLLGGLGEMREQDRSDPTPLKLVCDLEGNLRAIAVGPLVRGVAHEVLVGTGGRDEAVAFLVIDFGGPGRCRLKVGTQREEAKQTRVGREGM